MFHIQRKVQITLYFSDGLNVQVWGVMTQNDEQQKL